MWMCLKNSDEWGRGADVSFGDDAQTAFKNYRDYHDNEADEEDMLFYELPKAKTATVTWTLS